MKPQNNNAPVDASILDAEWLMIHADRFLSDRDRIILQEKAFIIDRDFSGASPNFTSVDKGYNTESNSRIF